MKYKSTLVLGVSVIATFLIATNCIINASSNFKEPKVKPSELPASAKFNPDRGTYYDSDIVEWDAEKKQYKAKEKFDSTSTTKKIKTIDEWVNAHKNSTDEIDVVIIEYLKSYDKYKEEHPEIMLSSKWEVGEDGPLKVLTNLGIKKVPSLVKHLDGDSPISVPILIAVEKMCRTHIADIDPSYQGVNNWKKELITKIKQSKEKSQLIISEIKKNKKIDKNAIKSKFEELGVLALPIVYNEVINNSNDELTEFIPYVLPEKYMSLYNDSNESEKKDLAKDLLSKCKEEVDFINDIGSELN
jgi:hypothetical protein